MKKVIMLNDEEVEIDVVEENSNFVLFKFGGQEYSVNLESNRDNKLSLKHLGKISSVVASENAFVVEGFEIQVALPNRTRTKKAQESHGAMISPMPGKILKILKNVGDEVTKGTGLIVMEAMKMEHTIKASKDGKIEKIFCKEGDQVKAQVELVKLC
jgi:biotin carboxyl carrier protein